MDQTVTVSLIDGVAIGLGGLLMIGGIFWFLWPRDAPEINPDKPVAGARPEERIHLMPAEARDLADAGNMIQAIKLVREQTGLGLKEAKDIVDAYRAGVH